MSSPTLIIGVGGVGSDIVGRVMTMLGDDRRSNVEFVVFDTDANDLRRRKIDFPDLKTVQTSPAMTVRECLDAYDGWEEWFPAHPVLQPKDMTQGAGQVRAISRLAFETIITNGKIEPLHEAIRSLYGISGDGMAQGVKVVICSCISGGTGSGLVLPLGLYLRNYFKTEFHTNNVIIRAHFVLPDVLTSTVIKNDAGQRRFLQSNAYATIREIDAFMRKGDGFNITEDYAAVTFDVPVAGTRRRESYPPLLPYDFVFMYDAQNLRGKVLKGKETYFDYVARSIYAQTLTPIGSRNNSAEDNLIRETIRSGGRSRYCGIGTAEIIYPFEDVRDYIAFERAQKSIQDEWMRIDDEYEKACREADARGDEVPEEGEFYIQTVDQLSTKHRFFENIFKQTQRKTKGADGLDYFDCSAELYVSALEDEVEMRLDSNGPLQAAFADFTNSSVVPDDDIEEAALVSKVIEFYSRAEEFSRTAERTANRYPNTVANALFDTSDEAKVKDARDYDILKWLVDTRGSFIHPSAARYLLHDIRRRLQEQKDEFEGIANGKKRHLEDFRKPEHFDDEGTPDVIEGFQQSVQIAANSVVNGGKLATIKRIVKREKTSATAMTLEEIIADIEEYGENSHSYYLNKGKAAVFEAAIRFVDDLLESYKSFFGQIRGKLSYMEQRRHEIAVNPKYNATTSEKNGVLYSAERYVCADKECLDRISMSTSFDGDASKLPSGVCEDIYKSVLSFADMKRKKTDAGMRAADIAAKAGEYFGNVFERAILDYWRSVVLSGSGSRFIDMDIVDAMRMEGFYRRGFDTTETQDGYARDIFLEGDVLSEPLMEDPAGIEPRPIKSCLFSSELLSDTQDASSKSSFVKTNFIEYNGIADENYTKYRVMIYKSIYGLRACQIAKFTPASVVQAGATCGDYYKSYADFIGHLGPLSDQNKEITPHLDTRWHWPFSFPNLDEQEEFYQKTRVIRAFVYGLAFGKIRVRDARPRPVYQIRLDSTYDLIVSNGTACDYFWEVFDALNINPPYVTMLVDESDKQRDKEKNAYTGIKHCGLIKAIGSPAFGTEVLKESDSFSFVIEEFSEDRRSLFEIPLLYKRSAPYGIASTSNVRQMLESVFSILENYFGDLEEPEHFEQNLAMLIDEQYALFEENLKKLDETVYPNIALDKLVFEIRARVVRWFDNAEMIDDALRVRVRVRSAECENAWKEICKQRGFDDIASE